MSVRIRFEGQDAGAKWRQAMEDNKSRMAYATTGGARDAAKVIETLGRQDIAAAGRFGRRWVQGLIVTVIPKTGYLLNAIIDISHSIPYARVFETGAVIRGKPLLWIPLSFANIKMRAREYARRFGGLVRVDRGGGKRPLLLSLRDRKPKYVGVQVVRLRKRFHLQRIAQQVMQRFVVFYNGNLKK